MIVSDVVMSSSQPNNRQKGSCRLGFCRSVIVPEGKDSFVDINLVLQQAVVQENHAKDSRSYGRFGDGNGKEKEKHRVNFIDKESAGNGDAEVCLVERVDMPKLISCAFLEPNTGQKDEMKYTFDVSKCDKLFNVLVQGGVIRLKEGHNIQAAEMIAKRKYCKWHDSYSHTTIEFNYFHR
jgi:hypothetical protein